MRVQHNIAALNSYRNFSTNNSKLNKNLEKLSTGYKINRAGDDAAGLAISEKMRAQISGIDGATKNAKDGISLIQTAEGALTEVHDMLNRMTTLAEQSANGTYDDEVDRVQLQKEVDALKSEIDRIADSTNYNGLKLLDGSLSEKSTTEIKELENTGKQVVEMKTGDDAAELTGFKVNGYQAQTNDSYTANVSAASNGLGTIATGGKLANTADQYVAVKIDFKDANGDARSVMLSTDKLGENGSTLEDLVNTLSGKSTDKFRYDVADETQHEALQALRDAFTFSMVKADGTEADTVANAANIKFTARDLDTKAEITGIKKNSAADTQTARTITVTTDDAAAKINGKPEGYELELGTTTGALSDQKTLTIGGRTYEFNSTNAVGKNSDGVTNTWVRRGANDKETMTNLVKVLKADGIDATDVTTYNGNNVAAGSKIQLRLTNDEQISESQAGAEVFASTDKIAIEKNAATKQTAQMNIGAASSGVTPPQKVVVRYTDAEGAIQSKELSFTATDASSTANATALKTALNLDSELTDLFEITTDGEVLKINSKMEGNVTGQFLGLDMKDGTAGSVSNMVVTPGQAEGKTLSMKPDASGDSYNVEAGDTVTVNGKTFQFARDLATDTGDNIAVLRGSDNAASLENLSKAMEKEGIKNSYDDVNKRIILEDQHNAHMGEVTTTENTALSLQIGDTGEDFNKMSVSVSDMHAASIGIGDVDISTQEGATAALDQIKNAVNFVSDVRGSLGALQNRLDHTINNLGVMKENIQNAESLIRDTDVAEEMMTYTKNNILNQSAQAMLAQANQLPQGVLQLLG